jgi:hypothetical protein
MSDDRKSWIILIIGAAIAGVALVNTYNTASSCHTIGGTMVQGFLRWVCIK